jgi:hypothetical protein
MMKLAFIMREESDFLQSIHRRVDANIRKSLMLTELTIYKILVWGQTPKVSVPKIQR